MTIQETPFPARIDRTIMGKMRTPAKENGRSLNKQIECSLRHHLIACEEANGEVAITQP